MTSAAQRPDPHHTAAYEDAAWVSITTPLSVADLRDFVGDIERLYRINPLLKISAFETTGENTYRLTGRNLSNGREMAVVAVTQSETAVELRYSHGLKAGTSFRAEPADGGALLVVTDIYGGGSEAERRARAGEVDLSLNAWGRALHDYLRAWARWR